MKISATRALSANEASAIEAGLSLANLSSNGLYRDKLGEEIKSLTKDEQGAILGSLGLVAAVVLTKLRPGIGFTDEQVLNMAFGRFESYKDLATSKFVNEILDGVSFFNDAYEMGYDSTFRDYTDADLARCQLTREAGAKLGVDYVTMDKFSDLFRVAESFTATHQPKNAIGVAFLEIFNDFGSDYERIVR